MTIKELFNEVERREASLTASRDAYWRTLEESNKDNADIGVVQHYAGMISELDITLREIKWTKNRLQEILASESEVE